MNIYAPVLIITLNRYEHFKRCVESLSACTDADKTDLYIAFDSPAKENHWEGYWRIEDYLTKIQGFKSVIIFKRSENFGPVKNHLEAQSKIFEKYDRVIFSEDDNVFGPSFLRFVNNGLMTYENRPDIFSISGYNYPFALPSCYKHDAYLITAFSAWGVGIWKDKWDKVDWSIENYITTLNKKENYRKIKRNYQIWFHDLLKIRDTGVITGDSLLILYLLENNMYSVFPVKSRVQNTGHDGSGINCGPSTIYINQQIYRGIEEVSFQQNLEPNRKVIIKFSKYLKKPLIDTIIGLIPNPIRKLKRWFI